MKKYVYKFGNKAEGRQVCKSTCERVRTRRNDKFKNSVSWFTITTEVGILYEAQQTSSRT